MLRTGIGGRFIQYFAIDTIEGSRVTQAKLSSCTRAKQCFAVSRSSLISREVCSDYGSITIQCSMTADVIAKSREVAYIPNRYGSNYQYEEECEQEYEQLIVDQETFVLVVDNDNTDIPNGLRITLTESQVTELNKQLEYLAEEQADQVLAA